MLELFIQTILALIAYRPFRYLRHGIESQLLWVFDFRGWTDGRTDGTGVLSTWCHENGHVETQQIPAKMEREATAPPETKVEKLTTIVPMNFLHRCSRRATKCYPILIRLCMYQQMRIFMRNWTVENTTANVRSIVNMAAIRRLANSDSAREHRLDISIFSDELYHSSCLSIICLAWRRLAQWKIH